MKNTRHGSALLAVLFSMMLISAFIAIVYTVTNHNSRITWRASNRLAAHAYADGLIESLYDQWRQQMISVTSSTDRRDGLSNTSLAANLTLPSNSDLPVPPNVILLNWSVTARTPLMTPTTRLDGRPVPENGTNSSLRVRLYYLATATMSYAGPTGLSQTTVQRVFVRAGRNLFDNFFFGTQSETEFHPGPPMYVDGTMYVGGNLYTAHDSLHFLKDVSFTGSHIINYRSNDPRFGTAPTILNGGLGDNWDLSNPPHLGSEQKLLDTARSSLDPVFLDDPTSNDIDSDGNPNNNGYREIIEEKVSGFDDPLQIDNPAGTSPSETSERLAANADYRIYVNLANQVTVFKGTSTTPLGNANAERTAIVNSLRTNTAIRDVRDGDNVRIVTMDVGLVRAATIAGTIVDNVGGNDGLLLYVRDTSVGTSAATVVRNSSTGATVNVTSNRSRGVKLINGALLPNPGGNTGFTVVSPNAVYIQGDYNSGRTGSIQPPSNTATSYTPPADRPSPVVTGYERAASAVVGDAVNILSNNWNDINSRTAKNTRIASNSTINTAIVAGNVPTTSSSYSGGIENFVRFHEDWSNRYLTIYGSLAQLYASQEATRPWSAASYTPPNRRWYYDDKLQDNNPPGFRVARAYERGRWTAR